MNANPQLMPHADESESARRLSADGALLMGDDDSGDAHIYFIAHGRRRHVPTMRWIAERGLDPDSVRRVPDDFLLSFKPGPAVPAGGLEAEFENPDAMLTTDEMRQLICSPLRGRGYEFTAGQHPILVPAEADVSYVDLPAYAAAAGEEYDDRMPCDLVDSFEAMEQIADESADFLIASHLIQRVRDPLAVIHRSYSRLRAGGHLLLIVPDQPRTMDAPRVTTSLDHLIADHFAPDRSRDLEHFIEYHRLITQTPAFETRAASDLKRNGELHYHTFTFESFARMVDYLHAQTPWRKIWSHPTRRSPGAAEFYWLFQK